MKVSQLREVLEKYSGEDELIVMFWEKPEMVHSDLTITDAGWVKIVAEFEEWDGADAHISDWLADAIIEHGEET